MASARDRAPASRVSPVQVQALSLHRRATSARETFDAGAKDDASGQQAFIALGPKGASDGQPLSYCLPKVSGDPMLVPRSLTPRARSSLPRIDWFGSAAPPSNSWITWTFSLIFYTASAAH